MDKTASQGRLAGGGSGPPAQDREARRRAAILEAARNLFQRYGYRKTTMEEIARDAGITKPTVYAYFEGKKDVLVSLVELEGSRVLEAGLASTDDGVGAVEQLAAMFVAADEFLEQDTFLRGIVGRDPDILTPEVIRVAFDFERRIINAVAKILEKGMDDGTIRKSDSRLMAYAMVRLHEAFTFSALFELEGYDNEQINAFFIDTMMYTLRPDG